MSLAHKLYKIGQLVSKKDIKEIIEIKEFKDLDSYKTIQIDFTKEKVTKNHNAIDKNRVMFTTKIGGTINSYYLYPNFAYQKESNLYKKFKAIAYTFENSIMLYANDEHKKLAKPILEYLQNYKDDILALKEYEKGNYFLIITINGKTIYELMPEIWDNYYDNFVEVFSRKILKKEYESLYKIDNNIVYIEMKKNNKKEYYEKLLQEDIDFITLKKDICGYNPNVKFFTMDNYDDEFKPQIINKLPMSKETATAIKKGWLYAINNLKFKHNKDLEYIIIPSMVNFDSEVYKRLLKFLKQSNTIEHISSKESSFIRRLSKQIEEFDKDKINSITLDILFTDINPTNLSVKIFATLEDVIPSRINRVVKEMQKQNISDSNFIDKTKENIVYLKDYFGRVESFANTTKSKGLDNKIRDERIILSKILLGYEKVDYIELLNRFEKEREVKYNFKDKKVEKRLIDSKNGDGKVMEWIEYPYRFIEKENRVIEFLSSIDAIKNRR